jgi:hypothetical protein
MISDFSSFHPAHAEAQDNGRGESGEPAQVVSQSPNKALAQSLIKVASPDDSIVPHGSGLVITALDAQPVQPVADVPAYLRTRTAQPSFVGEEPLLITLPAKVQAEVKALVRACEFVRSLVVKKLSVQAACGAALRIFSKWSWKLKTFRAKFDLWFTSKDWVALVNRAKAGPLWQAGQPQGLPEAFLVLCEQRFGQFKRADGKRQALFSIKRQWQTGRNENGDEEIVAGYEKIWAKRDRENFPTGWSYSNILTQIKKRARFTAATRALLHDSTSAAMQHLPQVLGTRKNLRFLEKITFDDVRTDWLVFNTATGQAEEMWVLVARDEATAMVLGFVMLPATVREDGKATHLGAQQMKELAGYLLQTYPLPVGYTVHWVVERGTATLAEAVKLALGELFDNRIKVHYTSMIGDKSVRGYAEKKKGNSRGKASHESHNRLFHTQGSWIGGQTGNRWDIRPAELNARVAEAREIYLNAQSLPPHLREQVKYPLPTPAIARDLFKQFCVEQNFRKEHALEDFADVLEVFVDGAWKNVADVADHSALPLRKRKEMPVERAMRLIKSVAKWDRCSPDIIKTFLEHTVRQRLVEVSGEIKLTHEEKLLTYKCPPGLALAPDTKCLCYFSPDDPQFLHVTSGDGRFYGTWYLRGRTEYLDHAALAEAMRYTHAARAAATATATELAAPEIASLAAMREHNAALEQFTVTADVPDALGTIDSTPVASGLLSVKSQKKETQKRTRARDEDQRIANEALEL